MPPRLLTFWISTWVHDVQTNERKKNSNDIIDEINNKKEKSGVILSKRRRVD
jgi:hypothetical protein